VDVAGPFYSAHGTAIESGAGATTGEGVVFLIAPAGNLKIEMKSPNPDGGACIQTLGGWGSGDGTITVPVFENTETSALIRCP
jgi:hypothetical protein